MWTQPCGLRSAATWYATLELVVMFAVPVLSGWIASRCSWVREYTLDGFGPADVQFTARRPVTSSSPTLIRLHD